jgi:hypothetical protein
MEKTVNVGGTDVRMRASALIPRLYRFKFGRDMVSDMRQLQKSYAKAAALPDTATEEERQDAQLSVLDLTIFENVAWLMAKHADKSVADDPDEWLDSFEGVFTIYEVLPQILELWSMNQATTSTPKKK